MKAIEKSLRLFNKLSLASYASGSVANVCWSPRIKDSIAEHVAPHIHAFHEILFVERGSGVHLINGHRIAAMAGHLAIMAPGSPHDPRLLEGAAVWTLAFNSHALEAEGWPGGIYAADNRPLGAALVLLQRLYMHPQRYLSYRIPAAERPTIVKTLHSIESENAQRQIGWQQLVGAHLQLLLVDLLRRQPQQPLEEPFPAHPIVGRAMSFIDRNFRRPIELRDIAKHVGRSPAYLTSLLKQYTGLYTVGAATCNRDHSTRTGWRTAHHA